MIDNSGIEIELTEDNNGKFRVSNKQAQADYSVVRTEKLDKNGQTRYKKNATTNDEKVADTCIALFQKSSLAKEFNYYELEQEAIKIIDPLFENKGLVVSNTNTDKYNADIKKRKDIGIQQYIREHIEKNVKLSYTVDFDSFFAATGIKSAERVGVALKLLDEIQSKNFYEWEDLALNGNLEIEKELVKVAVIPTVKLILDNEVEERTLTEFRNSPVKNKRKFIRGIKFDLNSTYLPNILGLGRDYTEPDKLERGKFKSAYSFRLDTLIKSIYKVQNNDKFNKFTFEKLQRKFGTQYTDWKNFKLKVLDISISEVNLYTDYHVEIIEIRRGGINKKRTELQFIKFKITKNGEVDENLRDGVDKTASYIAREMYFFSSTPVRSKKAFAKGIEKSSTNSLDLPLIYLDKTYEQWKEIASQAYEAESKLAFVIKNNKLFMSQKGLTYDRQRMCLVVKVVSTEEGVKKKTEIIRWGDKKVTNPMESLEYLDFALQDGFSERVDIFTFRPFAIAKSNSKEWIQIVTMVDYSDNEEVICQYIKDKKVKYFQFENTDTADLFYEHMYRGTFRQIDHDVREALS